MNDNIYYGGAFPSPPDKRDFKISRCMEIPATGVSETIPKEFECWIPSKFYNQESTGSCTAFAMSLIFSCIWYKMTGEERDFSTGYIYTNTLETDYKYRGAYMRDVVKTVQKHGDILAIIGDNNDEKPEAIKWFEENYPKFKDYAKMLVKSYVRISSAEEAVAFMYKYKIPLFVSMRVGEITPLTSDKNALHAIAMYKYESGTSRNPRFTSRNSWGQYNTSRITQKKFDQFEEVWGIVPNENLTFTDVEQDRWSKSAIDEAAQDGIILGYPDGTFKPAEGLSREEYAVMWERMKRYMDENYIRVER